MGLKYLLLLRFGVVNLVAFALIGAAWAQGLVAKVINADVTNMVILICVVFLIGLILAGYRIWKVSIQLNAAYNYNPDAPSRAADFLSKTKGKNASSRSNIAQALKLKLFSRIIHIRYIANSLTVLGLIGTVLGFIIALSGVDPDVASNPSAISPMVAQLIEGMSVALYTTLVGSILSVWLGLVYQMLATGTSNLVSTIIELSES